MEMYDIGIGWADPVEESFTTLLKEKTEERGLRFKEITFETLVDNLERIKQGELVFGKYFDRGSLDTPGFALAASLLAASDTTVINDPRAAAQAASKAYLYPKLKKTGLPLPPSFLIEKATPRDELDRIAKELKAPFVVLSSYGQGDLNDRLLLTAQTGNDIETFMEGNFADAFIAHAYTQPDVVNGKPAWFRPIYANGTVICLWWDPISHFYTEFGTSEVEQVVAEKLAPYMKTLHSITGLALFSSEFALTPEGELLLIDYANNPIDLNSSENVSGGLPPAVLTRVAIELLR